jgi:hypothetical protein
MANRIQLRRDGAQQWANANPVLAQGELGIEIDTGRIKIGDGVTKWNQLKYERPIETESNTANTLVKRNADGGFAAGAITASLIGNASTATRLANARQFTLSGAITSSGTFDGSSNLNLSTELTTISTLPHYDPEDPTATGTYTKVTVDSSGRVTSIPSQPTSLAGYGILDAQPLDPDLTALSNISSTGIYVRTGDGTSVTRSIAVSSSTRIVLSNATGVAGNPTLDLAETGVASPSPTYFGSGATQKLFNVPTISSATQTIYASRIGVDIWGRVYSIADFPIATAVEGTTASAWVTGTSYSRYTKVTNGGRLYQALTTGTSGGTAPTHTSGDASDGTVSWRHLGLVTSKQKGLASFDQEDFDVDVDGHVRISDAGVDNTQLQNNQIRFADGNSYTAYELDNELTSSTGYRGITTINDLSVNNTVGSPLLKCLAADDNVDINTTTSTIFSDITLDKTSTSIQTINRAGSLTILMDANTASNRFLRLRAENAGAGEAKLEISADEQISIISTNSDVRVEDLYFAGNILSSTNSTIVIDPAGVGDNTGTLQIKGNLQVDGTTTTVNSTTISIDDVILTLGGDTAPVTDDNKDRGVEFRYYDTQARLGFYGWDDSYTTLAGTTGGYRFLYNATNTSEVFSGTDAGVIAGNLALSSNVGSTSTSTGTLVVTGGTGISQNLWVGGTANVAGATTFQTTVDVTGATTFTGNVTSQTASKVYVNNTSDSDYAASISGTAYASLTDAQKGVFQVAGGISIAKNLLLGGNIKIYGDIDIAGAQNYSGAATFKGNVTTGTTSSKDADSNADTDVALRSFGGLVVDKRSIFTGNVYVNPTTGLTSPKFFVDASNGNTTVAGTLGVTNATTLSSTLGVTGITSITNATDSTTTGNGALVVSGGVGIAKQLRVAQATTLSSTLGVSGVTSITDATDANWASAIASGITYSTMASHPGSLLVTGGVDIAKSVIIGQNLKVFGSVDFGTSTGGGLAGEVNHYNKETFFDDVNFYDTATPTYINDWLSSVFCRGGVVIREDLFVGGDLQLRYQTNTTPGNSSGTDLVTFRVYRQTGQTDIYGVTTHGDDLFVKNGLAGATTFSVDAQTGDTTVGRNLTVTGNLTINGTTTTVNSTTITVDDPIITLGGNTAPISDDNKDRGVEFRYFDGSAKLGFFGWDDSSLGYRFLDTATNASEVFSGTDARIFAGRINLSLNVTSTSTTTGTLIVTGGTGISENLWVGGTANVAGNTTLQGTLGVTNATTLSSTLGVTGITSITNVTDSTTTGNGALVVSGGVGIAKQLRVGTTATITGATTLSSSLGVSGATTLSSSLGVSGVTTITDATGRTIPGGNNPPSLAGALQVTGGAHVGENLIVSGQLKVYGATIFQGGTDYQGTQTYSGVIKQSNTSDASSSTDVGSSISTAGGVAIAKKLFVGTDTSIGGTLTNTGTATFNGALVANGNITLGSDNADTLTVNAASSFVSTVSLTNTLSSTAAVNLNGGALSVKTSAGVDRFVFNPTTSTAVFTGTLGVSGLVTANGGLTVAGSTGTGEDFIVNDGTTTKFSVASASGNTLISGTLGVTALITATGGVSGNVTGNLTGNVTGNVTGNADTATTLANTRTFAISGDGTGTAQNFNGSQNVTIPFTLGNTGVTAGTYSNFTVDAKGRITSATPNPYSTSKYTGDGSTKVFDLTLNRSVDELMVAVAGLIQMPTDDYTTTNATSKTATGYATTTKTASGYVSTIKSCSTFLGVNTITTTSSVDDLDIGMALSGGTAVNGRYITAITPNSPVVGTNTITLTGSAQATSTLNVTFTPDPDGSASTYTIANPYINVNNTTGLIVGMSVTGGSVGVSASIVAIVGNKLILNVANTAYFSGQTLTFSPQANEIYVNNTTGLVLGMPVSGGGVGSSARITSINGLTIGLSVANSSFFSSQSVNFGAVLSFVSAPANSNKIQIRYLPV